MQETITHETLTLKTDLTEYGICCFNSAGERVEPDTHKERVLLLDILSNNGVSLVVFSAEPLTHISDADGIGLITDETIVFPSEGVIDPSDLDVGRTVTVSFGSWQPVCFVGKKVNEFICSYALFIMFELPSGVLILTNMLETRIDKILN